MKYLYLSLIALSLGACSLSPYRSQNAQPPDELDQPQEQAALQEQSSAITTQTRPTVDELEASSGYVPNTSQDKTTSNIEDVSQSQFSYIDQKYGNQKEGIKEEQDATNDDLTVTLQNKKPKKTLDGTAPDTALRYLKNGNTRFVKGRLRKDGQSLKDVKRLSKSEKPHAIILTTSDSRVSPEIIFDEKLGEIFVVRVFGLKVDSAVLNSLEYATRYLGTRLLVVMDRNYPENKSSDKSHAQNVINKILELSPTLQDLSSSEQLKIVPAVYSLETGRVTF